MNGLINLQQSFRQEKREEQFQSRDNLSAMEPPQGGKGKLSQEDSEFRRQTVKGRSRSWATLKNKKHSTVLKKKTQKNKTSKENHATLIISHEPGASSAAN